MLKNLFYRFQVLILLSSFLASCAELKSFKFEVRNNLNFQRSEVVSIHIRDLKGVSSENFNSLHIQNPNTKKYQRTQLIDNNSDGSWDNLLFQAEIPADQSKTYILVIDSTIAEPKSNVVAYSRFVPERTDDYTWENDKVAFRTYGPTGEKEALAGVPGSTLSSGIDLWLKRTDESIINTWYARNDSVPGYYHTDRGQGYDPYHVGSSRGTGGIGVWNKDSLYVSNNFISYRTIADGPLRTVFELTYAPWSPYKVQETKRITLDLGSNFSKFEIKLAAADSVPNYTIGIALHKNDGDHSLNKEKGWFRYWEAIDDSYVGEGIVLNPRVIDSAFIRENKVPDQRNLLIVTAPTDTLTYYAGFAWKKSGQITTEQDWDKLLKKQTEIIENPLQIKLLRN